MCYNKLEARQKQRRHKVVTDTIREEVGTGPTATRVLYGSIMRKLDPTLDQTLATITAEKETSRKRRRTDIEIEDHVVQLLSSDGYAKKEQLRIIQSCHALYCGGQKLSDAKYKLLSSTFPGVFTPLPVKDTVIPLLMSPRIAPPVGRKLPYTSLLFVLSACQRIHRKFKKYYPGAIRGINVRIDTMPSILKS